MKKLLFLSLMLFLVIQAGAQTIKIRWYDINTPGTRHTVKIDPAGEPSGKYFLAVEYQGEFFQGEEMYRLLQEDLWPDVPFELYVQALSDELPPRRMRIQDEYGNKMTVPNPDYVAAIEYRDALLDAFHQRFLTIYPEVRFVWVQLRVFKTLPDGPTIRWESVDDEQPFRYRFTPMDVVPGLYAQKYKWTEYPTPGDEYWQKITREISTRIATKGPVKGLKWLCNIK